MAVALVPADSDKAHTTPPRRSGSIRRTSSMEMTFPDRLGGGYVLQGRARDALTRSAGSAPEILAEDTLRAEISADRRFLSLATDPLIPADIDLIGHSTMARYRATIAPAVARPDLTDRPLALLLDDMVGSTIISKWVAFRCDEEPSAGPGGADKENICTGYATGSPSLTSSTREIPDVLLPPLQSEADPHAFHALAPDAGRTVRRVRRVDVWREGAGLGIDAMFQDSGFTPAGERIAIHEYRFFAKASPNQEGEMVLTHLDFVPGALPYDACRGAPLHAPLLYGTPLPELRRRVLAELRGPLGCTHLNDAMRSIGAATAISAALPA